MSGAGALRTPNTPLRTLTVLLCRRHYNRPDRTLTVTNQLTAGNSRMDTAISGGERLKSSARSATPHPHSRRVRHRHVTMT